MLWPVKNERALSRSWESFGSSMIPSATISRSKGAMMSKSNIEVVDGAVGSVTTVWV